MKQHDQQKFLSKDNMSNIWIWIYKTNQLRL